MFFYKNDSLLLILFVYSFFLGFVVLKYKNKYLLFNDSTILFLIFLFLYGIFNPIIEFLLQNNLSSATYFATIIYASCIPSYIIGSLCLSSFGFDLKYNNLTFHHNFKKNSYHLFLFIVLFLFLSYISYDFYSQGILFNPFYALKISRFDLFTSPSQIKVVIGLLITSIFLYFIYYFKFLSAKVKLIVILFLLYYIIMELSVGNRRDFVPMIVGFFWVFVNFKKIEFTFIRFIYLIIGIFLFLFLGSIRSSSSNGDEFNFFELVFLTLSSNEFVYPFYTLIHSVEKYQIGTLNLFYGLTVFIYPVLYLIPRVLFPDKPISLAVQFVSEIESKQGYAYTPVTDFFINFGILGPFFSFFLVGFIVSKLQSLKDQRIIFIFFTMIPDFCRGEIGIFIYQFIFICFFILILPCFMKSFSFKRN